MIVGIFNYGRGIFSIKLYYKKLKKTARQTGSAGCLTFKLIITNFTLLPYLDLEHSEYSIYFFTILLTCSTLPLSSVKVAKYIPAGCALRSNEFTFF